MVSLNTWLHVIVVTETNREPDNCSSAKSSESINELKGRVTNWLSNRYVEARISKLELP